MIVWRSRWRDRRTTIAGFGCAKQSSAQCKPPLDCFRLRAPRFGGLKPTEARRASAGGSSLTLLAMTTKLITCYPVLRAGTLAFHHGHTSAARR